MRERSGTLKSGGGADRPRPRAGVPFRQFSFSDVVLFALLLGIRLFGGSVLFAQAAGDTVYAVHGRVVNGVTGAPLARTLVTSADRRLATMTDSEGRFALKLSVPASREDSSVRMTSAGISAFSPFGELSLQAQKPGFLADTTRNYLPIDDKLSSTDLQLRLMPAATIDGRVSAEGAEVAAEVRVQLLLNQAADGRRSWQTVGSYSTDGRGEFHFSNLRPGEYTVVTSTWQGDQPLAREHADSVLAYPPVFYGDTADIPGSTKLHLHFGDTVQAVLHLHREMFYRVSVPVAVGTVRQAINARLTGAQVLEDYPFRYNQREGVVEGSLPNGTYSLGLASYGQEQAFANVVLHVSGAPVHTAPVTLSPPGDVTVHVKFELSQERRNQPSSVSVRLRPEDHGSLGPSDSGLMDANDDLTLHNVQPGMYDVFTDISAGYVAAMTCGGTDLSRHPVTVGAHGLRDPIEITVRDDAGELTGKVNRAGPSGTADPPGWGGVVSLVPLEGAGDLRLGTLQSDGSYTIANVPPGSYVLLAGTGDIFQTAYREEQTIHILAAKGKIVSIKVGKQTADAAWTGDSAGVGP